MKKLLVLSNLVLLAALVVAIGVAWAGHTRAALAMDQAQRALEEAMSSRALAEQAARQRAAAPAPVDHVIAEVGDVIETVDAYNAELAQKAAVQPDGKVLLRDVGWLDVAGKTREEIEALLTPAYSPYYQELRLHAIVHKRASLDATALELAERLTSARAPGAAPVAQVGDVIETLDQHREIDFGERAQVQADGKVLLLDLGWVDVAGKTREELERMLTDAYAPYYTGLTVNVILHKREAPITKYESKRFDDF